MLIRRTALEPLRVNHARINADARRRLNHRLHRPVPEVLRHRVGNEENVAVTDGNIGIETAQHALQIERRNSAAALLLANEHGLCQRSILSPDPTPATGPARQSSSAQDRPENLPAG